jgi:hypothetical protein
MTEGAMRFRSMKSNGSLIEIQPGSKHQASSLEFGLAREASSNE